MPITFIPLIWPKASNYNTLLPHEVRFIDAIKCHYTLAKVIFWGLLPLWIVALYFYDIYREVRLHQLHTEKK